MEEHRHDMRVDCEQKCIIRQKGWFYPAVVRNISFGGALVHTYRPLLDVRVGDKCVVSIDGEFHQEYSCEVARSEDISIGLAFTGVHKLTTRRPSFLPYIESGQGQ